MNEHPTYELLLMRATRRYRLGKITRGPYGFAPLQCRDALGK